MRKVRLKEWDGVVGIDPEFTWSYGRLLGCVKRLVVKHTNCCDVSGFELEETDLLKNLRKYRLPEHDHCKGCVLPRGVLEDGVHILARSYNNWCADGIIWWYYTLRRRWHGMCKHALFNALKELTGYLKQGGPYGIPIWRELCYWEMNMGYREYSTDEKMMPKVEDGLLKKRDTGKALDEDLYCSLVYREVRSFMDQEWKKPDNIPTVDEWVSTGKWMRGKSGTGGKVDVYVDGKRKRSRSMKSVEAALHSDEEIKTNLYTRVVERMVVMQKSEGGKIRPVVKTGNDINRKMDFISEVLERGLFGSTTSTLFLDAVGVEAVDNEILEAVRNKGLWKVPLDESSFDQRQSKNTVIAALLAIYDHLCDAGVPAEYICVFDILLDSLLIFGADVELGGKVVGHWENGIPSGWRWTAVLDTIINIASFTVIYKLSCYRMGHFPRIYSKKFQGDDIEISVADLDLIRFSIDTYGRLGYEVHPQKVYISKNRTEFLRRSYEDFGVTGYTNRTLLSMRYRNPILAPPPNL